MDAHVTVGVLGGMGPAATVDFMRRVIRRTPAEGDQDHLHLLVDSDPTVPDRTAHLFGSGRSPLPHLLRMATGLEGVGVSFLVMPCNTAHAYYDELAAGVHIPFLNMIELAAGEVADRLEQGVSVGLLATSGTLGTSLYQDAVRREWAGRTAGREGTEAELVLPEVDEQEAVQAAIYQVKHGETGAAVQTLAPTVQSMQRRGAHTFLLGCTEVPLIIEAGFPDLPVVNATECLARETVRRASLDLEVTGAARSAQGAGHAPSWETSDAD